MRKFVNVKSGEIIYVHEWDKTKLLKMKLNSFKYKEMFSNEK